MSLLDSAKHFHIPPNLANTVSSLKLSSSDIHVLILTACLSEGKDGVCWAAKTTMAAEIGICERKVRISRAKLVKSRLISRIEQDDYTCYAPNWDASEECHLSREDWKKTISAELSARDLYVLLALIADPFAKRGDIVAATGILPNEVSRSLSKIRPLELSLPRVSETCQSGCQKRAPKEILTESLSNITRPPKPADRAIQDDTMPLIELPTKQPPPEEVLARRLWQWLKDHKKDLATTKFAPVFPKVWTKKMASLISQVGDTAVKQTLDRLIEAWSKLTKEDRPAHISLFCTISYFQHVLPKKLDKATGKTASAPLVEKCPDWLQRSWFDVQNMRWAGNSLDWKKRLTCVVISAKSLRTIRGHLREVRDGTKDQVSVVIINRFLVALEGHTSAKWLLELRPFVQRVCKDQDASFDYLTPKITLVPAKCDQHLGMTKLLERFKKSSAYSFLVQTIKDSPPYEDHQLHGSGASPKDGGVRPHGEQGRAPGGRPPLAKKRHVPVEGG